MRKQAHHDCQPVWGLVIGSQVATMGDMEKELLRPSTAAARYDMSRRTFDRRMRAPGSPQPIRLSRRMVLFKRAELDAFFSSMQASSANTMEAVNA